MKNTKILPMLFVVLLLSITTKAQLVSYNGQDGENENAVNETPQEIIDRTINHKASARLVPYKECSRETFQKALNGPVGSVEKSDMIAWINRVNNLEHAATFNGSYVITTDAEATRFLKNHLILINNDGKEYVFKGLDYKLNSQKTGEIKRGPYASKKEKEMWFALGNFSSGHNHPGGSAMCGNTFASDQSGASSTQASPKTFGEKEYKGEQQSAQQKQMSPKAQKFFKDAAASADAQTAQGLSTATPVIVNNFNYVEGATAKIDRSGNSDARAMATSPSSGAVVPVAVTPVPQPVAPGYNPNDWGPGQQTVSTTRVAPGYNQNAQGGYTDPYGASDNAYLKRTANATTATAVGTFLGVITNAVTGGMTVNALRHQPAPSNNYYYNGYSNNGSTYTNNTGQNWTGGTLGNNGYNTTTGQNWTGQ